MLYRGVLRGTLRAILEVSTLAPRLEAADAAAFLKAVGKRDSRSSGSVDAKS